MRANNERSPLVLRVNSLQCAREELLQSLHHSRRRRNCRQLLASRNFSAVSGRQSENLPGFAAGFFQVQGEASQLVAFLLSPLPGERILDACAAPGGKSTHVAELMKDQGELIAIDMSARGIERIRQNVAGLDLNRCTSCAPTSVKNCRASRRDTSTVFLSTRLAAVSARFAPIPKSNGSETKATFKRLSRLQAKILRRVVAYLKPGGVLVYSTCTLSRAENEQNIELFLG